MPKTQFVPEVGDKFYACFEAEAAAGKIDTKGQLGGRTLGGKNRKVKLLKIEEVHHKTQVPEGLAPTWCIKIDDVCYDAAWSDKLKAWVYGGANSGIKA